MGRRSVVAFVLGALASATVLTRADVSRPVRDPDCGAASQTQVRTTLYFGLGRPKGMVSELEWQLFMRDEITPRFPQGLTVWDAQGQWQSQAGAIGQERTKVLLLVHPSTAGAQEAVQAVIGRYRKAFEQESVLWESARVCAVS